MAKQNGSTPDDAQTSVLEAPVQPAPKKPQPVQLRAPHDFSITVTALEHRAEEIAKLAKKASEEGYAREAKAIQADADAITYSILPLFRDQLPLPLVSEEDLERDIAAAIRTGVFRAFDGLDNPKTMPTVAGIQRRRDDLIKVLADRITTFAIVVADEAFKQGLAAREQSPQRIAQRSVTDLRVS